MSCQRCGGRCQGRYCRPCEREIHRGVRATDDSYPMSQQSTDPTADASTAEQNPAYPHQAELANMPLSCRAVYRELEVADEPLTLQAIEQRLRTPRRTVRKAAADLVEADLASRYPDLGDGRETIYVLGDDQPDWIEERDRS